MKWKNKTLKEVKIQDEEKKVQEKKEEHKGNDLECNLMNSKEEFGVSIVKSLSYQKLSYEGEIYYYDHKILVFEWENQVIKQG